MVLAFSQAYVLHQVILEKQANKLMANGNTRGDMAKKMTLDLTGVVSPMDLLKCNACLAAMAPGDNLEAILEDVEVVGNVTQIVLRSNDDILYRRKGPDGICVGIRQVPRQY